MAALLEPKFYDQFSMTGFLPLVNGQQVYHNKYSMASEN